MIRQKAFTLTELLIALAIVGAIAALTIPSLLEDINRRVTANQLKNVIVTVQQLMNEELINKNTKSLANTDFASVGDLYNHFTNATICGSTNPCWGPNIESSNNYRSLKELKATRSYPGANTGGRKLKNGVSILYQLTTSNDEYTAQTIDDGTPEGDKCYGLFYIDINGKDKPNIIGRDLFAFRITEKGNITYGTSCNGKTNTQSDETLLNYCKEGGTLTACTALIQRHNWRITY